jgi:hypothetical protein
VCIACIAELSYVNELSYAAFVTRIRFGSSPSVLVDGKYLALLNYGFIGFMAFGLMRWPGGRGSLVIVNLFIRV